MRGFFIYLQIKLNFDKLLLMNTKFKSYYNSPLGKIIIVADNASVCGVYFDNQKYMPENLEDYEINDNILAIKEVKNWLDEYFEGKNPSVKNLSIKLIGSEFKLLVWSVLKTIPYGKTLTYGEIAQMLSKKMNKEKMSARAVGCAVGHNPISIIIPCHRVLGKNNKITGYAGGINKKLELLKLEGINVNNLK